LSRLITGALVKRVGGFTLIDGRAVILGVTVELITDEHNQTIADALAKATELAKQGGVNLSTVEAARAALSCVSDEGDRSVWDVAVTVDSERGDERLHNETHKRLLDWTGVWAVYFPRDQQTLKMIEDKLKADIDAARKHNPEFLAFVTNQELRQSERTQLRALGGDIRIDLFHLERVATILDRPRMAPVREQFLRIRQEMRIREKSNEGHARVRAEREAKEQAEQEARARRAQEEAKKAQQQALDAVRPKRPWDVVIDRPPLSEVINQSGLLDSIARQYSRPSVHYLPRLAGVPGSGEPPKPPEPLTDEQIEAKVATYQAELESRWPSCRDYLAGIAWPALHCRIKNEAKSFLTDVEVVLTFHGARGIDFENLDDFE
ncbi:hypothetical protein ADUPG1_006259, partial [Aduncisulcus paluster]